jgi:RimJ/RimL family protein N-acetyltransferase
MIIANVFAPSWTWRGGAPQPEATAVIGYVTDPPFRRKGVATAMVCEIPRLAGVRSVLAAVDPANVASEGVLRNCGFRPTGQETGGLRVWCWEDAPAGI